MITGINTNPAQFALPISSSATLAVAEEGAVSSESVVPQLEAVRRKAEVALTQNQAVIELAQGGGEQQASANVVFARSGVANNQLQAELGQLAAQLAAPSDNGPRVSPLAVDESHVDFFNTIAAGMDRLQKGWVDPNQQALQKFLGFFQEFSKIMVGLKDAITAGKDGKVKVDFASLRTQLTQMLGRYDTNAMGEFASRATAEQFLSDAGLSAADFPITALGNGKFGIGMPESVVQTVIDSMPDLLGIPQEWDSARYNAWLSGKDSQVERLQHSSQVLAERFSRVNDILNNLIKVLSATIDSITEADKGFAQSL
jgi:type III secretion system IpaD/SipD/SspD family effector